MFGNYPQFVLMTCCVSSGQIFFAVVNMGFPKLFLIGQVGNSKKRWIIITNLLFFITVRSRPIENSYFFGLDFNLIRPHDRMMANFSAKN